MEPPKEIEERMINEIVTGYLRKRRSNKRILVIFTVLSVFSFQMLLLAVIKKDIFLGLSQIYLTGMFIFITREAYRDAL
jgi:hypothetical protein